MTKPTESRAARGLSSGPGSGRSWRGPSVAAALLLAAALPLGATARPAHAPGDAAVLSAPALTLLHWIAQTADNEGQPFAIIDKRRARLWLFDRQGHRQGDTPVLLGLARGDASVPGIGERPLKDVRPFERTTPAGRFIVHPGRNLQQEDIFWVDYEAAVSLHRVRATNPAERRLERLATSSPLDNRISYGCINVPPAFYDGRIRPLFLPAHAVVYLLPETMPLTALFRPGPDRAANAP